MERRSPGDRLRNLARRSCFQKAWFIPVWLGLGIASLIIACIPFRYIAPRLGRYGGTTVPEVAVSGVNEHRANEIRRTIQFAVSYSPWRADCYPQAMVARALLGIHRLPFVLCLGLRRNSGSGAVEAHAWTLSGAVEVTGGKDLGNYTVVGVYSD